MHSPNTATLRTAREHLMLSRNDASRYAVSEARTRIVRMVSAELATRTLNTKI